MSPHDDAILRALLDDTPVGVAVCDAQLRIVDCNGRLLEMMNATRAQILGTELGNVRSPGLLAALHTALRGEKGSYTGQHDTTFVEPPLHVFLSARTSPLVDALGKVTGVVLMAADLTALHDAERKQRESEQRYRELVELSPEPIFVHDGRRFLYANPALLRAFGLVSLDELLARPPSDFVHPAEATNVDARLTQVGSGRPTTFVAQRFVRADGTEGDAEVASIPLVYEGTRAVLTVARDVSERKKAERVSRALECRVRAQFEAIPVPTYAWERSPGSSDEFVLVDFNDPALELSEGRLSGMLGITLTDMYGADSEISRDIRTCLGGGETLHREFDHALPTTGKKLRLSVTYVAVPPNLVLAFAENVTERSRLEEELRQAQKMEAIGRLAGGVAHDFNNLLTVIGAFAESVRRTLDQDDSRTIEMGEIVKAADRGASLTRQLLTVSHKQILSPQNIVLDDVVDTLSPMLRRLIGEDINVVVVAGAGRARVNADPRQLEQLLLNLAVNARDAMPNGGTLTLETSLSDDQVSLIVRDTGHGMDEETRKRIFEPFFTTKGVGRGTGLGLSTVYGIVQQSSGTIEVTSQPTEGTTFVVRFPRTSLDVAEPPPAAPVPAAATRCGSGTVLLVEDDRAVRKAVQRMLERSGYVVHLAHDGAHAIELLPTIEGEIDLVVTDVVMPGLSGPEMFAKLAAIRSGLRVLYVSGYNDEEIFRRGTLPPGVTFLQKPFTADVFVARVAEVIGTVK